MSIYLSLKNIISVLTGLLFILPLLFWRHSTYPFIFIKVAWLQVGATLIFVSYFIALLYYWRRLRPRLSWLGLAVFLFYFAVAMSAVLGVDQWRSWWSRPERLTGLFVLLHYGVLFLVWRSVLSRAAWEKLWQFFVAGPGLLAVLAGVIQVFFPRFLLNIGSERVGATLGNAIYAATFYLFIFFSTVIFWQRTFSKWRYLWLAEAVLAVLALFASQTRGALIGFWFGLVLLGVLVLFLDTELRAKFRKPAVILLVVLVTLPLLVFALRDTFVVRAVPGLSRFVSTPLEQANGGSRLIFWRMSMDGWKEKPWFGWGWENFFQMADTEYRPEILRYTGALTWTDNAHNVLFNTLATTGTVGLLSYLAIYFCLYFFLFKNFRQRPASEKTLAIGLAALFGAHFVQNLFAFENLSSYLFFFWLLAGVDVMFNRTSEEMPVATPAKKIPGRWFKVLIFFGKAIRALAVFAVVVGAVALLNRFVVIPAKGERMAAAAVEQAMVDFEGALQIHRQALKIQPNPYSTEFSFGFGQFLLVWLSNHLDFAASEQYRPLAMQMYDVGVKAMYYYLAAHPQDTMAGNLLASGYHDGYEMFQQLSYLAAAEDMYLKTLAFSPKRQVLMYGLAQVEIKLDKPDEAVKWARKAVAEDETIAQSHFILALALQDKGDARGAFDSLKRAEELGYVFSQHELSQAFQIYDAVGRAAELEPEVRKRLYGGEMALSRRLILVYVDYLRKTDRAVEAAELEKLVNK